MGGNEELTPLKAAVDILREDDSGASRNIFLLTDGGVGMGGNCSIPQLIDFGKENKDFAAVHTIGVGSGVELDFCKQMASVSNGHCTIVSESDMRNGEMNGMIINALEEAAQIGMLATQAEIVGAKVLMESPTLPKFVREGMIYRKLAILETQDMSNVSLKLRFKNPREGYELTEQIYSFAEAPVVN